MTARRVHIPGLSSVMAFEYWWLQAAMLIIVPPRLRAVSSGQGDMFTRCHEWRVLVMVIAETGAVLRLIWYCSLLLFGGFELFRGF